MREYVCVPRVARAEGSTQRSAESQALPKPPTHPQAADKAQSAHYSRIIRGPLPVEVTSAVAEGGRQGGCVLGVGGCETVGDLGTACTA